MTQISQIQGDTNNFIIDGKVTPAIYVASKLSSTIVILKNKSTDVTFKSLTISDLIINGTVPTSANNAVQMLNQFVGAFISGTSGSTQPDTQPDT
ncbi:MAG: hypothetical protein LBS50_10260, partial [Prevotellaceae bacterium]|nr:hypothetical protein [Prevotellaceae bacterium]